MKKYKGQSKGHGECRSLSYEEIEKMKDKLTPPLTPEEVYQKQLREYIRPDKSHITLYVP